ncbi:MAG TPA: ATP-binding protein [Nitrosomonas sp.]|nr:ATP-binding protein [Nitrosomonas sp.]
MHSEPKRKRFDEIDPLKRLHRTEDRNKIIHLIRDAVDKANSNSKRLLFLEGDAGVGKTVLLGDLQHFLKEHEPDWRILGFYDAQTFVANQPFARFIELMNGCAGKILVTPQNPLEITLEEIIRCANLLELELTNRANEPLILIFDELEWWLDTEGEEREALDHLFRIVWRVLLRQAAMPCIIVCAGRRLPVFRDLLLRRTLETIPIKGFEMYTLQSVIDAIQDPASVNFVLSRADGNPWVAELLAHEVQKNPDMWTRSQLIEHLLGQVFDRLLSDRLNPHLANTLYKLVRTHPEGFYSENKSLSDGDLTIAHLIRSSFVYFDNDTVRYLIADVLTSLFYPTTKESTQ